MRRFLKNIAVFVLFASLFVSSAFYAISVSETFIYRTNIKLTTGGYGFSLPRYREISNTDYVDALFLGSSHVYRSMDPRVFAKADHSIFVLGNSAQSPLNAYYLLKTYLPEVITQDVFLEVYYKSLSNNGLESGIDIISNAPLKDPLKQMILEIPSKSALISYWAQSIRRTRFPLDKAQQQTISKDRYVGNGYVETIRKTNAEGIDLNRLIYSFNAPTQLDYIDSLKYICSKYKVRLHLFMAPVNKAYLKRASNRDEMDLLFTRFAHSRDLPFVNFNDSVHYHKMHFDPEKDWYDHTHLTQTGAEKFDRYFMRVFPMPH
jgi:hypothetical protein